MPVPGIGFIGGLVQALVGVIIMIVFVLGAAFLTLQVMRRARRGAGPGVYARVYDPNSLEERLVRLDEISTGVYRTEDGDLVVIPENARWYRSGRARIVPVIRVGRRLVYTDPVAAFEIGLILDSEEVQAEDVAELIATLYGKGRLPARLRLTPRTSLAVYIDPGRAAKVISELADRMAEDAIIGVTNMTGARREFEEYVKTVLEYEKGRAAAFERRLMAIATAIVVVLTIIGILAVMLGR